MNRGLIVSCQALPNEPLHSSFIMAKLALAAKQGGAVGIRANGVADIKAIQGEVDLPIIGIIKRHHEQLIPYITPTFKEIEELMTTGIEVIALDATFNQSEAFLQQLFLKYPRQKFMADIATVEEGIRADKLGFHYIASTLVKEPLCNFDVLAGLIEHCQKPIVAEGHFDTPVKARKALEMGAFSVVVGSAITRPQEITHKFHVEMLKVIGS